MTPLERRGKWLFLIIATLIALDGLATVGLNLTGESGEFSWYKSIVRPLGLAMAVAGLWTGSAWLRWVVGAVCSFSGVLIAATSLKVLITFARETPPEGADFYLRLIGLPVGLYALYGLLYLLAGGLIILAPSLEAFFRYQREGPQIVVKIERF